MFPCLFHCTGGCLALIHFWCCILVFPAPTWISSTLRTPCMLCCSPGPWLSQVQSAALTGPAFCLAAEVLIRRKMLLLSSLLRRMITFCFIAARLRMPPDLILSIKWPWADAWMEGIHFSHLIFCSVLFLSWRLNFRRQQHFAKTKQTKLNKTTMMVSEWWAQTSQPVPFC